MTEPIDQAGSGQPWQSCAHIPCWRLEALAEIGLVLVIPKEKQCDTAVYFGLLSWVKSRAWMRPAGPCELNLMRFSAAS